MGQDRITLFDEQLKAGNTDDLDDLIISQDEINGIIGRSDYLRGNACITFEEGTVYEELSLPTDMLPGGAGRYFVAHDYIKMQGEDRIESRLKQLHFITTGLMVHSYLPSSNTW